MIWRLETAKYDNHRVFDGTNRKAQSLNSFRWLYRMLHWREVQVPNNDGPFLVFGRLACSGRHILWQAILCAHGRRFWFDTLVTDGANSRVRSTSSRCISMNWFAAMSLNMWTPYISSRARPTRVYPTSLKGSAEPCGGIPAEFLRNSCRIPPEFPANLECSSSAYRISNENPSDLKLDALLRRVGRAPLIHRA